jgi:mRNA interferase MazF
MNLSKGDIVYVNLNPVQGSETGKTRPCIIIQNNVLNKNTPTIIVAVITGRDRLKKKYPSHVWINKGDAGLTKDSTIQCEQIRTIDKSRIVKKIGSVNHYCLQKIEEAIKITLSFGKYSNL